MSHSAGSIRWVRDEFMEGLLAQAGEMTILISSHELSEIDGVATDVGFLDQGQLLFQESMSDLTARFRKVHITLQREAAAPERIPKEWLEVRAVGNVLSFVDTRFTENLNQGIRSRMEGVRDIQCQPMALRSIFTTLARAARDGAA
jgi:ABC-2 type transport system ATP-binding protein